MNTFFNSIVEMLIPAECAICSRIIHYSKHGVCDECRNNLVDSVTDQYGASDEIDKEYSLFLYDDAVRRLIISYKDRSIKHIGIFCAIKMHDLLIREKLNINMITFVPLSCAKRRSRGFNQAALLAHELSNRCGVPCMSLLDVKKSGTEQKLLGRQERLNNVNNRYTMPKKTEVDGSLLLVDDVMTTGATLRECARLLKKNGADNVFSLTIGRVA